jgi:hypothetical protein
VVEHRPHQHPGQAAAFERRRYLGVVHHQHIAHAAVIGAAAHPAHTQLEAAALGVMDHVSRAGGVGFGHG